jgi:hypothetical protein
LNFLWGWFDLFSYIVKRKGHCVIFPIAKTNWTIEPSSISFSGGYGSPKIRSETGYRKVWILEWLKRAVVSLNFVRLVQNCHSFWLIFSLGCVMAPQIFWWYCYLFSMKSVVCVVSGVLFIPHALQKINYSKEDYLVREAFYFPVCILIITKLLFSYFLFSFS